MAEPEGWSGATKIIAAVVVGMYIVLSGIFGNHLQSQLRWESLIVAAGSGNVNVVRNLLDSGANPHADTVEGKTAMRSAIDSAHEPDANYVRIVGLFIDHGADVNQALRVAIDNDKPAIVQLVISKGADVNQRYPDGGTPLSDAKRDNCVEIIKLLKKAGARK